jgi:hypothetical protein
MERSQPNKPIQQHELAHTVVNVPVTAQRRRCAAQFTTQPSPEKPSHTYTHKREREREEREREREREERKGARKQASGAKRKAGKSCLQNPHISCRRQKGQICRRPRASTTQPHIQHKHTHTTSTHTPHHTHTPHQHTHTPHHKHTHTNKHTYKQTNTHTHTPHNTHTTGNTPTCATARPASSMSWSVENPSDAPINSTSI